MNEPVSDTTSERTQPFFPDLSERILPRESTPYPNPVFLLERRQTVRSYQIALLVVIGLAMGGVAFIHAGYPPFRSVLIIANSIISITYFAIGVLLLPLSVARKFSAQQLEEDLLLRTPLTPFAVMTGKLNAALLSMACLFGTSLPGFLFHAASMEVLYVPVVGFIASFCLTLIGLGFAAGSRSLLLRGLLLCFGVLFLCSGLFMMGTIVSFVGDRLGYSYEYRHVNNFLLFLTGSSFALVCSIAMFAMGLLTFKPSRELSNILVVATSLAVLVSPGATIVFAIVSHGYPEAIAAMLIGWGVFIASPLLTMLAVLIHDRRRISTLALVRDNNDS